MSLTSLIVGKFGKRYIAKGLKSVRVILAGKKTYGGAVFGIVSSVVAFQNGSLTADKAAGAIWVSVMFMFSRAAQSKIIKKVEDNLTKDATGDLKEG